MKYEVVLNEFQSIFVKNATGLTIADGIYCITDSKNNLLFSAPKERVIYIVEVEETAEVTIKANFDELSAEELEVLKDTIKKLPLNFHGL